MRLIPAEKASPDDILQASGYLFVCPENLGTMSGTMKEFFDRNYYPVLGQIEGRAYATAIAAGSDGAGAQAQIDRVVTGWRLRRVAPPMIINVRAQSAEAILAEKRLGFEQEEQCRLLGEHMGEGLRLGIF